MILTRRHQLATVEDRLPNIRAKVLRDLKSPDDRRAALALAVALMLQTGERPGNLASAADGHFGITTLPWRSVTLAGSRVTLRYTGKAGVRHEKDFSNAHIADALRRFARGRRPGDRILTLPSGEVVSTDAVNDYFRKMSGGATVRVLRALKVNQLVGQFEAKGNSPTASITKAARKIGHGRTVLKNHYLK